MILTKNYCCMDCGDKISLFTALYGKGRCHTCASKGIHNANFGKKLSKNIRLKMSKSSKGQIMSLEARLKMSLAKKGKKFSLEHRKNLSLAAKGKHSGKNNSRYIHGQGNFPYPPIFNDDLKLKIRQRDNFRCLCCRLKESFRKLDVHHIDYNKFNCNESNLVTLCNSCNIKANYNLDYWYAYYTYIMENNNDISVG